MISPNDDAMSEAYNPQKKEKRADAAERTPVDNMFDDAECVEILGDPKYAYIDPEAPDPAAFNETLDLARFERTGLSEDDMDTLKAFAFGSAYFLSLYTRTDKYGKDGEPDDHDGRTAWVKANEVKPSGAEFRKRYKANRLRLNSMTLMLSRVASLKALIERYDIMPMKAELQKVLDALPPEITTMPRPDDNTEDPAAREIVPTSSSDMGSRVEKFKQRYNGPSKVPPPPSGSIADIMAALEKIPHTGKKGEDLTPFLLADKKRIAAQFEEAARLLLAIVEKHDTSLASAA